MYDPLLGRFTSRDPVWDVNLYEYGKDNPWSNIDPSGMQAQGPGARLPWREERKLADYNLSPSSDALHYRYVRHLMVMINRTNNGRFDRTPGNLANYWVRELWRTLDLLREPAPARGMPVDPLAVGAAGATWARDANIRLRSYDAPARANAAKIEKRLNGAMQDNEATQDPEAALKLAREASEGRTELLNTARGKLTVPGALASRAIKEEGPSFEYYRRRYAARELMRGDETIRNQLTGKLKSIDPRSQRFEDALRRVTRDPAFDREVEKLRASSPAFAAKMEEAAAQEKVLREIIHGAGRTNRPMTRLANIGRFAGPVLLIGGVAVTCYEVYNTSPRERAYVLGRDIAGAVGSYAGDVTALCALTLLGGAPIWAVFVVGLAGSVIGTSVAEALYRWALTTNFGRPLAIYPNPSDDPYHTTLPGNVPDPPDPTGFSFPHVQSLSPIRP